MSDELIIVKAARNYADDIDNDRGIEMGLPDCLREAANLIERLTAQVDGLQDEIKRLREQVRFASETDPAMRAEAAEAERDRLKAALDALEAVRSDLPEKVSEQWLYEGVRHWHHNCDWDDPRDGSPLNRGDGATVAKILNMIPRKALGGDA